MKTSKLILFFVLIFSSNLGFCQQINPFLDDYTFHKLAKSGTANNYQGIDGNPYLNKEFSKGFCSLKDSNVVELPLRLNVYSDEMEYSLNNVTYSIGNKESIDKISIGESVYRILPFIPKGGYFEILESGKCFLAQKRIVKFYEAEAAKPIEGISKPARFVNESDIFYLVFNESKFYKITNTKSAVEALQDQKSKIESYIDKEKIKNTKKENLIKIVKYYNSL